MIADFVATGQATLEYRDLAFLGEESVLAAEAAACALDQGRFWQYHDTLFLNQRGRNIGSYMPANLSAMAAAIGLDLPSFNQCLDSHRHAAEIAAMENEARELGVRRTPSVVVNGTLIEITSYADLKSAIEAALGR